MRKDGHRIYRQNEIAMNVLIIEDEKKTALDLKHMIENACDEMRVVDIIATVSDGVKRLCDDITPDLIFSDIELADGLSFEIFKTVEIQAPIVFCTAFEEYAIQAFESNGIDYLLKPIDEEKLQHAIRKLEHTVIPDFSNRKEGYRAKINDVLNEMDLSRKQSLLAYYKNKIIPIKTSEISMIHSDEGTASAYLKDGRVFVIDKSLEELENELDPHLFFRANRQFIINKNEVKDIEYHLTRRLSVQMKQDAPETIIVSKLKAKSLLAWLEQ